MKFKPISVMLGLSASLAATSCAPDESLPGDTAGTATWNANLGYFFSDGCGGCHATPPGGTGCVAEKCFVDDPCILAERGCCTAEEPFFSCEDRLAQYGTLSGGTLTVAQCGYLRVALAASLAEEGVAADAGGSAGEAAVFFRQSGALATMPQAAMDEFLNWLMAGQPMGDLCEPPDGARP